MDNDRTSLEHSFDEQRRSNESHIILELLDRQNAFGRKKSQRVSKVVLKAGYRFFFRHLTISIQFIIIIDREKLDLRSRSDKRNIFIFALFTSLVTFAGVLTVCLTAPKPSMYEFEIDFEFLAHGKI
jgi:hypothetical protein